MFPGRSLTFAALTLGILTSEFRVPSSLHADARGMQLLQAPDRDLLPLQRLDGADSGGGGRSGRDAGRSVAGGGAADGLLVEERLAAQWCVDN